MLKLEGITKYFSGRHALGPVDLEAAAGETVVLLGASGCGKTTLLRSVLGLIETDQGRIEVAGHTLTEAFIPLIRSSVGYVRQGGSLFPHLTAGDNAALLADLAGWDDARRNARLRELWRLVQLDESLMASFPAQLSGGQLQRVALVRALMLDAPVLLLDEPLGALDPLVRYELQTDLKRIFASLGKAVLLVTHDLAEASRLADRVALMRNGVVVQSGPFQALLDDPTDDYVRRFVDAQRPEAPQPKHAENKESVDAG